MANVLLVTLPSLLLKDLFHLSFCMFDNRGIDTDGVWWDERVTSNCVVSRAKLVYFGQAENITDRDITNTRDSEQVFGGEEVATLVEGCNDIVGGLGSEERKRRG